VFHCFVFVIESCINNIKKYNIILKYILDIIVPIKLLNIYWLKSVLTGSDIIVFFFKNIAGIEIEKKSYKYSIYI